MPQTRAADDFKTIRARLEELQHEKRRGEPAAASANIIGHRGPCACGMSLFADECDGYCKAL